MAGRLGEAQANETTLTDQVRADHETNNWNNINNVDGDDGGDLPAGSGTLRNQTEDGRPTPLSHGTERM